MPTDLLTLLDAGEALSPPERALLLAGEARTPLEPVGRTTARLLRLHQELGAPVLEGTVACPACEATVELEVAVADLLAAEVEIDPEPAGLPGVTWRPVSYDDLVLAAQAADRADGVAVVLSRCVEGEVDPALRPLLSSAMTQADPLADIELDLRCADCGAEVRASLDVLDFVWARLSARADSLLVEIDTLARAYSWSEHEIRALSDTRRRRFVHLVTGGA